jgi:DNA polymerase-3 subunit gamma/tau
MAVQVHKTTPVAPVAAAPVVATRVEPAPAPAAKPAEPPVVAEAPPAATSKGDFWKDFLARVHVERQLVSHWLEDGGALLAMEERKFKIGLPESEVGPRSMIMTGVNKSTLERIASELVGRPLTMEVVLDPSLKVPEHAPEPQPEPALAAPSAAAKPAEAALPPASTKPTAEDLHEPLIMAAMEKFKASLVTS